MLPVPLRRASSAGFAYSTGWLLSWRSRWHQRARRRHRVCGNVTHHNYSSGLLLPEILRNLEEDDYARYDFFLIPSR